MSRFGKRTFKNAYLISFIKEFVRQIRTDDVRDLQISYAIIGTQRIKYQNAGSGKCKFIAMMRLVTTLKVNSLFYPLRTSFQIRLNIDCVFAIIKVSLESRKANKCDSPMFVLINWNN